MISYRDRLLAHLTSYRTKMLEGLADSGAEATSHGHILPEDLHRLNILESYREDFWRYAKTRSEVWALHTYFRHLNSSQAFAFNLLFPFVAEPAQDAILLDALGVRSLTSANAEFEFMPDQAEGTTVDFTTMLDGGRRLLVEVKLTESEFGSRVPKESHVAKLNGTYRRMLADKVSAETLEQGVFFANYQLCRNVAHLDIARGDQLIILLPRANTITWQQGERFIRERLLDIARQHVSLIAAEDVVASVLADSRCTPRLRTQFEQISEKYLLTA
jgi:hypothetical protein